MSDRCFVIQPFDGERFDKRYKDVFAPAIRDAGLEPYRVDHDPSSQVPIDTIASEIDAAIICLADVSTNNPNVWFELGFAIARRKDVILLCSDEREGPFPFDVQHRRIVKYQTQSLGDYSKLAASITEAMKSRIDNARRMKQVVSVEAEVQGLQSHEIATLVAIAQHNIGEDDICTKQDLEREMENAGHNALATALGLRNVLEKRLAYADSVYRCDIYENRYEQPGFRVTDSGFAWLNDNQSLLSLRARPSTAGEETPF